MCLRNNIVVSCQLLVVSLILALSSFACAEESVPTKLPSKEPIVVNGDKVEYFHEKQQVVGFGNISITYKDVILTCDKVTVYLDTKEAIAEGNVKVTQAGAYLTGDRMNYNFDTKQGTVLNGYLNAKPFYGKAKDVEKIANKDQFNLNSGYATTCDIDKPHYRVESKRVEVYLNDKVVAKHIFLYVGNVPVLYLPYYVQSLKDKKSHITVMVGQSKDWGYYALTAYRYYLGDNNRGDILLDYRTKKGLAGGINHYYNFKDFGVGTVKFYYTKENELVYDKMAPAKDRYRWQVRHRWDLGEDTDTLATLEFNKLSDRDVIKDYFYNEYEEIGQEPDNYISFVTQKSAYSTRFLMRKRFDNFYNVVERLPDYTIDIPNYRIFKNIPLYYNANMGAAYLNRTFDNTNANPPQKDLSAVRANAYNQLSYAARLFRFWSITPYAGVEETYYSKNRWGEVNQARTIFNAGLNNSTKFYKIYDVVTNFWGLDINKLRHVITPTINYFYVHQPSIDRNNLNQFDEIDAISAQNGVSLGLENRLQTKRLEAGQMKSVDLATLRINTDYLLNLENDRWVNGGLDKIYFDLELVPYSWAYIQVKTTLNAKNQTFESESIDLVANWKDRWSVAISNRYESVATGNSNLLTFDGTYKVSPKWKVRAYERFNAINGYIEEQEYTLSRDLHCWVAELIYNVKNDGNMSLWFVMHLKAFPAYPIGFKQTYSRPRFGSTGDK